MPSIERLFGSQRSTKPPSALAEAIALLLLGTLIYAGARLALRSPAVLDGPTISLAPAALPWYALRSIGRMLCAYILSILFSLAYGYAAAHNKQVEKVLMPLLDVLQSVPILSFLPVVLLSFSAIFPQGLAAELAAIVLIFTSQAWNLTFAWYQSLTTIPNELREASATFRFSGWLRFKTLELPSGALSLVWNSMMSWAGGWFFLMAAEIFKLGERDFRLPGLGAYLQEAAWQGDLRAVWWGLGTLILVIVALDQLVWRPLLAWSDRFKLETVESQNPPTSWFYDLLRASRLRVWFLRSLRGMLDRLEAWQPRHVRPRAVAQPSRIGRLLGVLLGVVALLGLGYGGYRAGEMLLQVTLAQWGLIMVGVGATLLRVVIALLIALAWTIPLGVLIGTNHGVATWLQPLAQIAASVPATALFPVLLLFILRIPNGIHLAAVLLMLMGTQWYLLFNIIAGATAIPQDLRYTAALLQLDWRARWRTLILPALFPYIVTGAITASGGAWNASIVAEHVDFGGQTLSIAGIGTLIFEATSQGDYPLLLAATMSLVVTVVLINRLLWRKLYRLAEERYRME